MLPLLQLGTEGLANTAANAAGTALDTANAGTAFIQGNLQYLVLGVIFIVVALVILNYVKNLIVNSILGFLGWLFINYGLPAIGVHISLPFFLSLVVSAIFGLAGIGVMIMLAFFGVQL